ncbi:hypothetical protein ACNKHK_05220 [Shigella flexneri]
MDYHHRDSPLSDDTSDMIDMVGGAPLVVKLVEGTQGIGVVLAETRQAAESVVDAFGGLNAIFWFRIYQRSEGARYPLFRGGRRRSGRH